MKNILLVGAGKIGAMISEMLTSSGDYHVTIADISKSALSKMPKGKKSATLVLDVTKKKDLLKALEGKYAVLSAVPFNFTKFIAEAAVEAEVHYFDLTEDVATTKLVKGLAKKAKSVLMPQCGLAPGFISIVTYDLTKKFDELDEVHMRVGALSEHPTNAFRYNPTWSIEGLINEYIQPCEAVVDGQLVKTPALDGLETFSMDGVSYEAFNTSGGLGTLAETLKGKVNRLDYKSIRYPGHREILSILLNDFKLRDNPQLLVDMIRHAIPYTHQGVVIIFATVKGKIDGLYVEETYAHKVYSTEEGEKRWSAIQITTAAAICAVLDLQVQGKLPKKGFIHQEDVDYQDFIHNRFGKYYERRRRDRRLDDE